MLLSSSLPYCHPAAKGADVVGLRSLALGLGAGLLASCSTEPFCSLNVVPGVVVEIRDGYDGAPLAATARGAVRESGFVDSLRPYGGLGNGTLVSRAAADERAGTYIVTVEHDGYLTWQSRARVRKNECHVETVFLIAYLQAVQ
jgi:hypothetical protein